MVSPPSTPTHPTLWASSPKTNKKPIKQNKKTKNKQKTPQKERSKALPPKEQPNQQKYAVNFVLANYSRA